MTATTTQPTRIKLLASYDLRTIDPISGKKEPLAEGDGCTCDRCGKIHAVVYQVAEFARHSSGRLYPVAGTIREVGSTCFKKVYNQTPASMGWGDTMNELTGKDARRVFARVMESKA